MRSWTAGLDTPTIEPLAPRLTSGAALVAELRRREGLEP